MPESFEIDPQRELVICRVWGVLTDAEVRNHYKRMVVDPAFRSSYRQLADLRGVTCFGSLRRCSRRGGLAGHQRGAVVTGSKPVRTSPVLASAGQFTA